MDLYVSGLGGKYVKNLEENKKVSSQDGYIIIHKETMINYFFTGVLVLAFGVFIAMLITGIINMKIQDENAIDGSIIAYNQDDLLNITYPVPGGSWTFVDVDTTELSVEGDIVSLQYNDKQTSRKGENLFTKIFK